MSTLSTCPRCFASVDDAEECPGCGLRFRKSGALLDVLADSEREQRAAEVEAFYQEIPFPGYEPGDDGGLLLDKSRRSAFLVSLDDAIPTDSTILDCGCGTGQLAAFLALSARRRQVFGIDGCRASLALAEEFRARTRLENLQLVRADLFDLPVEPGSFEVVVSRGVVHHTTDVEEAIECVARCVRPGGFLVLGFYETAARLFHRVRRALGRLTGSPIALLDPILRQRGMDPEKQRIWIRDQYHHPLERILPLPWVLELLERLGFRWVRSIPPAPEGSGLFEATVRPGPPGLWSLRMGWRLRGWKDPDAGLICVVARRHS